MIDNLSDIARVDFLNLERKVDKDKSFDEYMEVEITEDVSRNIKRASQELGVDEKELVRRAVRFYLHRIIEEEGLKEELEAWEKAGIESLRLM